jgi:hypothetical protein
LFVKVITLVALVVPTNWFPNVNEAGVKATGAMPVPLNVIV